VASHLIRRRSISNPFLCQPPDRWLPLLTDH
jgi:hypothetical protein